MKKYAVWRKLLGVMLCVYMVLSWGTVSAFATEEVPENPQCFCVEKCTDVNEWCDICGVDYTACSGEGEVAAYATGLTVTIDTGAKITLTDSNDDGYYEIGTADQLYAFAAMVNGGDSTIRGILTADIVVNRGVMSESSTNVRSWTPIGNSDNYYWGTFDGAGHTISGLYHNSSSDYVGLFGFMYGGTIKNVTVCNSYFSGNNRVGGVVGNSYGTVENCTNEGTVTGNNSVGGVVGYSNGAVENCTNEGIVTGNESVGGVVGYGNDGTVENGTNEGSVTGTTSVGGIVGYSYSDTVENGTNEGLVAGITNVGGIVGYSNDSTVENGTNMGAVTSSGNCVGGVVGYNDAGTVTDCSNTGAVTGVNSVGGVTGYSKKVSTRGIVTGCNNAGTVTGSGDGVGGVAGYIYNSGLENCINKGAVIGNRHVGGVAGFMESRYGRIGSTYVADCTNEGTVTGSGNCVGGVVGYIPDEGENATVSNCDNRGDVTGSGDYVGGVVGCVDQSGTKIMNCTNKGTVTGSGDEVGGVVGHISYSSVSECSNEGAVTGTAQVGGVAGYSYGGTVANCANTGVVTGSGGYVGGVVGQYGKGIPNGAKGTVANCSNTGAVSGKEAVGGVVGGGYNCKVTDSYYLDNCGAAGSGTAKSEEAFASGEVTYLLNGGVTDGTQVWHQTIGTDSVPRFAGSVVYSSKDCMGNASYANTQKEDGYHAAFRTYEVHVKDATCTENGRTDTVTCCAACEEEISRETTVIPALGHTEGRGVVEDEIDATCTENGSFDTVTYCTVCKEEISRETTVVPALGHAFRNGSCTACGQADTAAKIEIATQPVKTEYNVGEELDTAGLAIQVFFTHGGSREITEGFQVTGFDAQRVGKQKITVTYGDAAATFVIILKGSYLMGDADGNKEVDFSDAVLVLEYSALLIDDTQLNLDALDVNGDGFVDFSDAVLILEYSAFLIDRFPVE